MGKYVVSCFKCALLSFVFAPPLTAAFLSIVLQVYSFFESGDLFGAIKAFPFLWRLAYIFGGFPAILAAVIYGAICMKLRSPLFRACVSIIVGLSVWLVALSFLMPHFQNSIDWSSLILYLLPAPSSLILSDAFELLDFFGRKREIDSPGAHCVHRSKQ